MWFTYMDEAGNTGRNLADAQQPVHLILSLSLEESRVMAAHDHVRAVAERHFGAVGLSSEFEFHGHAIFSGSGPFKALAPGARIAIYDELLQAIPALDAQIVVRGVHKPGLAERYANPYHPHDIALMFTIESIERMAKERGCRTLLVADEAREVEDAALRDLASYQALGTRWGWNTERIDCIIDTIHFVRSETNPAIQLADCATFIAARQRRIQLGYSAPNAAVTRLWERYIEPCVWENAVWFPAVATTARS